MWNRVPQPVRRLVEELEGLGGVAALVGGCVRDLARGAPVRDWDVATAVEPEAVLEHFARAVPTGLRFGTVMLPTPAGPVDVTRLRGPNLAADLARRDFTINAMALLRGAEEPDDPHGGAADFAAGRLRAVGEPEQRLAEDPLRALRAARFRAELGLVPDAPLERAMAGVAARLPEVAGERVRAELDRLLVARDAPAAITLLRRCGIEAVIVPGARSDVARVVEHLPPDRSLRLAAWLRGVAKPGRVLARLRLGSERRREVEALLALHPVDRHVGPAPRALRRLLRRMGEEGTQRLLALRRAELDGARPEDLAPLARLEAGLDAVRAAGPLALRRRDLALSGAQVMAALGCGPGPRVGRALGHLLDCVLDDPACNTEAALRERLERFAAQDG